jgi:hypothetical protein
MQNTYLQDHNIKRVKFRVPILLIGFNRPEAFETVLEAIRLVNPEKIYIALDGPREGVDLDIQKIGACKKKLNNINDECVIKTLFRDKNLGCKRSVSQAIDWLFSSEERGIILEDDCVPNPSFFRYAEELLDKFSDDERIMSIGSQQYFKSLSQSEYSYSFSKYHHCWGWATWKRAWKKYDGSMTKWPLLRENNWLTGVGGYAGFETYWKPIFDKCYDGKISSWAYAWSLSCWTQSGLSIIPQKTLVRNIGFGDEATHTFKAPNSLMDIPVGEILFPIIHPENVYVNQIGDLWVDKYFFEISFCSELKRRLVALPGGVIFLKISAATKSLLGKFKD